MKIVNENIKTAISFITSIISMMIGLVISFFLAPFIVKHLGTEANGYAQLANNFIVYASLITLALNSMTGRFVSVELHKKNYLKANSYYSSVVIGNCFTLLFLSIIAVILIFNLEDILVISGISVADVRLVFIFTFTNYFINVALSILNITFYVKNILYISNIINAFKIVFNGLLLFYIFRHFNPHIFYIGMIGCLTTCLTIPALIMSKHKYMCEVVFNKKYFSFKYLYTLVSSGIWNSINQGGNILMTGFDLLIANLLIDPVNMGILAIAKTVPNAILSIGMILNSSVSPLLTMSYACEDKSLLIKQLRLNMKASSILMSTPIILFAVFGIDFYTLWMPSLDPKQLAILSVLSVLAYIPMAGPQVLYNVFTTMNKLHLNSITFILTGVVNVFVVYILLKFTELGVYAVAGVSQVLTIVRNLTFTVPYTAKLLQMKWYVFYKDVAISILCCIITFVLSTIIKFFFKSDSWFSLSLFIVLAGILSVFVNFVVVFTGDERKKLFVTIKNRKK